MNLDVTGYLPPRLYDVAYSWYTADVDFYVGLARASRGPVLEVGCGTGRVLLPTLRAGVDIDGLDLHPGMIEVLRRKAAPAAPRLVVADMRDFTMPRRYRLITIPFRAFLHLATTADQVRALRCIREHLEPDGRLVLDVFHPAFAALVDPGHPVHADHEVVDPATGRRLVLHNVEVRIDRVAQTLEVERELRELDASGGVIDPHRHRFALRWVYKAEMELLLDKAGFTRYEVRGGFDGRPLERDDDQMVWTAWKE